MCSLRSPISVCDFHVGNARNFPRVLHVVEERQHLTELVRRIGPERSFTLSSRAESVQAFVGKVPDFHSTDCSLSLNTCQYDCSGLSSDMVHTQKRMQRHATEI